MTEEFDDINELVKHLETEYNITILSIRDYGSRAWNLDSETSDMDAGIVFVQPAENYYTLKNYRENIDRKFKLDGEDFEVIGWNAKRFAELLNSSNPSIVEWLNSDLIYYESKVPQFGENIEVVMDSDAIFEDLRRHANEQFKPVSLFHHYRSMAQSNYSKYIENRNDLSIKRHLYILRGITYAKYVEETHEAPPLDYHAFYDNHLKELNQEEDLIPEWVYKYIGVFIQKKKEGKGSDELADEELWSWIGGQLKEMEGIDNKPHNVRGIETEKVNNFLKKVIN